MEYTKPPLPLKGQADLLISRGMEGDRDLMIERLKSVSYYRLTGYWHPFRRTDDSFAPGTNFENVWYRYAFDRRLRCLVLDAIERFEIALRTSLSYEHSHEFGPFGYATDATSIANQESEHFQTFIEQVRGETDRSSEVFVKHFRNKYGNCHDFLPIWMATELMSYGTIMTLYNHCPIHIRDSVASQFGLPRKVFASWLLALNAVRNICAHHSRLWNRILGVKPTIPRAKHYPEWHIPGPIRNDRIYAALTFCRFSLRIIAPQSNWPARLRELLADFSEIPLAEMGFPEHWETCPLWSN